MGTLLIAALGTVLIGAALVGIAAHAIDSRRQLLLVAAALTPPLLVLAPVGAIVFAVGGQWLGVAAGILVSAMGAATQWPLYRAKKPVSQGSTEVVLLQANLFIGNADAAALVARVDNVEADILTICELTEEGLQRLIAAGLCQRLPHSYVSTAPGGRGTGIWSRYPLTEQHRYDGFETEMLSARVDAPEWRSPSVFAVHPQPPWPLHPETWLREMGLLRTIFDAVPDDRPVLVGGDFNATYDHKPYRALLDDRYSDAAIATGAGIQPTYAADTWYPPIIAIDHILTSDATALVVRAVDLPGSDHRGIWARIAL
ncbi:endonuclease/exonuclease/phosphatase family protein [Antrihabitans cavernicola]|uniref:Endonuclease/exonuclease/phosphatase family protein n=1 Tax=Antrihabitans cavernicola TaxID=2495913 RepID=A0A5A7SH05_9NOCA|nr:endonuclease/exonuclease/phosphatase family protein [Spelaeibacter cavernicola]KAA0024669.1 endonuclease/exonuclease/phosphatase family protein [Spelaeibacter cavernicola]